MATDVFFDRRFGRHSKNMEERLAQLADQTPKTIEVTDLNGAIEVAQQRKADPTAFETIKLFMRVYWSSSVKQVEKRTGGYIHVREIYLGEPLPSATPEQIARMITQTEKAMSKHRFAWKELFVKISVWGTAFELHDKRLDPGQLIVVDCPGLTYNETYAHVTGSVGLSKIE